MAGEGRGGNWGELGRVWGGCGVGVGGKEKGKPDWRRVCADVNSLRLAIIVDMLLLAGFDRSEPHREHHAESADQHEAHADEAALQVLDRHLVADRFLDESIELVLSDGEGRCRL